MKKNILLLGMISLLNVCPAVTQASGPLIAEEARMLKGLVPDETEISETPYQQSVAHSVSEWIKSLKQKGMLQDNGTFVFKDENTTVSGQLLCDDTLITEKVKTLESSFKSPDLDVNAVRQDLNALLKCVSVSGFETKDDASGTATVFTGHYSYPAFDDASVITGESNGLEYQVNYGLNDRQQTVNVHVASAEGKALGNFVAEYNVDASSPIFELGMIMGISKVVFPNVGIEEKIQQELLGLSFPIWKSSRFSKAEIYRPTGEALLLYNKDLNDNYTVDIFSSENKKVTALNWNGQVLNIKVDFPKSNAALLETKLTFPADFGEKYEKYLEKLYVNKGVQWQNEMQQEAMNLIAGVKNEGVVYGLNGKPLAQFNVKLKNEVNLNGVMTNGKPMDLLDSFEVKNLGESGCSINTISFTQAKPNVLTICRTDGCQDENLETMTSMPEIMGCFAELPVVFQRFQNELEQEAEALSKVFMRGALGGIAMKRYVANAILDNAAKVAVIAMSKNAGRGADSNLADLGGVAILDDELKKIILTDSSIQSDKVGRVTIELEPNAAKDIMPLLRELIGNKVISGCTADTNICVFRLW